VEPLTEIEKVRRREYVRDARSAAKAGMSLEEFERAREQRVQRWIELFHSEMERARAHDPAEVLPTILAKVEESCIAAARAIAKREAEDTVSAMLRKALA
jgi:hypothetical protein